MIEGSPVWGHVNFSHWVAPATFNTLHTYSTKSIFFGRSALCIAHVRPPLSHGTRDCVGEVADMHSLSSQSHASDIVRVANIRNTEIKLQRPLKLPRAPVLTPNRQ